MQFIRIKKSICLGICLSLLAIHPACITGSPYPTTIHKSLPNTIKRSELIEIFGHTGNHQFTTQWEGRYLTGTSYYFKNLDTSYLFTFNQELLMGIHNLKHLDIEKNTIHELSFNNGLTIQSFNELKTIEKEVNHGTFSEYLMWSPVMLMSIVVLPVTIPMGIVYQAKESQRVNKYMAQNITLGMSELELIKILEEPTFKVVDAEKTILIFGPKGTLTNVDPNYIKLKDNTKKFWISVEVQDDQVYAVYSNAYLDDKLYFRSEHIIDPKVKKMYSPTAVYRK